MKTCDIVTDLLPLYYDDVCNESSKNLVEEHLAECENCQSLLAKMEDNIIEEQVQTQRENIIGQYKQSVRKKYFIALSVMLLIPVVVTFIVNLATAGTLSWFFIVLTAIAVAGALILVPLVVEKERGLWTLASFIGSLFLMLITIDIFTKGRSWSLIPISAILLASSIIFAPFVLSRFTLKGKLNNHKGLLAMASNTVLLYLLLIVIGLRVSNPNYWRNSFLIAAICILLPWAIFLTTKYLKFNALIKTGLSFIYAAIFMAFLDGSIFLIVYRTWQSNLNAYNLIVSLVTAGIGVILVGIGLLITKKKKV